MAPHVPSPAPRLPPSAEIRVGENGRIHGVDGMLDQIAGALVKQARPLLVNDVIPVLRHDANMQTRIGSAIGQAVAAEYKPWIVLGAGALAVLAIVAVARAKSSSKPLRDPRTMRRRRR
jgi:hypothetical protein